MSLVTVAQARALINTSLSDANLQVVIDRVEAEFTARIGEPQNDANSVTITKTLPGEGENIFLPSEIGSVVSIVEIEDGTTETTLVSTDYRVWGCGVIERMPEGTHWEDQVRVTYKPTDDRLRRAGAIIDVVRLDLNRTAMNSESIAGEYAYTAPQNWEAVRRRIIRRVAFPVVG
jgi:hypothetical protein